MSSRYAIQKHYFHVIRYSSISTTYFIGLNTLTFHHWENHIDNYSEQANISMDRVIQFLASALFYDLDLSTDIRSLRGTYTG